MMIVIVVNGEKHSEEHVAMDRWRRTGGRLVCYVCVSLLCGSTCSCMRKPGRLRASVELDALALVGTNAFGFLAIRNATLSVKCRERSRRDVDIVIPWWR